MVLNNWKSKSRFMSFRYFIQSNKWETNDSIVKGTLKK